MLSILSLEVIWGGCGAGWFATIAAATKWGLSVLVCRRCCLELDEEVKGLLACLSASSEEVVGWKGYRDKASIGGKTGDFESPLIGI